MSTIFSRIIKGEIPGYKIAEDDNFYAFLDISPLRIGHTLVVPKTEIDYLFDIDDDKLGEMMIFSKKVACAIRKAYQCNRIGIAVLGLEVPHAHIHLVPMDSMEDINFRNPKLKLSAEEFAEIAGKISREVKL